MGDARQILQPVAGATGNKAKATDLIRERMRSPQGVLQRFLRYFHADQVPREDQ